MKRGLFSAILLLLSYSSNTYIQYCRIVLYFDPAQPHISVTVTIIGYITIISQFNNIISILLTKKLLLQQPQPEVGMHHLDLRYKNANHQQPHLKIRLHLAAHCS